MGGAEAACGRPGIAVADEEDAVALLGEHALGEEVGERALDHHAGGEEVDLAGGGAEAGDVAAGEQAGLDVLEDAQAREVARVNRGEGIVEGREAPAQAAN